ncbi:DUF3859 domain-containing protein [Yoonia maritima]|uniref:DUF3859 domain-containing protein n=1 Tax=Yoonia maritima TaxID=1435347 RepID=UPI000D0F552D|nr:DUF3859 domain-containing protein [Yoonia maritima]
MKHWLTFFLLILVPTLGSADPDMVSSEIASIEIGIVCPPDPISVKPAPNTLAGTTHIIDESPPFVSNSQMVPAAYGVGFGVKSLARREEGLEGVTIAITHPPMGDSGTTMQSFGTRISGIDPSISFYQFDYGYELQPGTWTMTALRNGKQLYAVTFEVVAPERLPELAAACGYIDLLS